MGLSQKSTMKSYTNFNENHACAEIQHSICPPGKNTSSPAYATTILSAYTVVKGSTSSPSFALLCLLLPTHIGKAIALVYSGLSLFLWFIPVRYN